MKKTYHASSRLRTALLLLLLLWGAFSARAQVSYSVQSSPFPTLSFPNRQGFVDVDKDGDLDLLYQSGNTANQGIGLHVNNGGGSYTTIAANTSGTFTSGPLNGITFTHVVFGTVSNGYALFAVDYDKDGDTDIVQMVNNAAGSLFRNNGNGSFSSVTNPFIQLSIASRRVFIDVNNDGAIDQLYQDGSTAGANIGVQINNGNGTLTTTTANASGTFTSGPLNGVTLTGVISAGDPSVFAVDYDNDGDSDLLTAPNGAAGTLYRNNGGSFTAVINPFPALTFASRRRFVDVDADGAVDMLYQDGNTANTGIGLLLNNGSGTFTNTAANSSGIFTSGPLSGIDFDAISQTSPGLYPSDYDTDSDTDLIEFTAGVGGRVIRQEGNPPLLVASTPADNATGVAPTTNITLVFDKNVTKSSGNFYVVRTSDNATIETIPVGDARVTGSGTTWTINPNSTLALGTSYAIRIDEGVFRDASNRAYAGIFDNTTLNFTTYNTATVTTTTPASVTATSALLGGNVTADGGASVTERGVVYLQGTGTPTTSNTKVTLGTGTGTFSQTVSGLTANTQYTVRAYAINTAGTSYGAAISFTTLPNAPVVFTPANGSITNNAQPVFSGTSTANSSVTVYVDGANRGTVTADASGNWSFTIPAVLTQGSHTTYATATVGALTSANSNTNTFVIDTTPPAAPVLTTPANGAAVATTTPAYSGTAEAGTSVKVYVDGSAIGSATGSGTWSFVQPSALAQGSHTVRATATDAAGNVSVSSNTNTFIVDTVSPTVVISSSVGASGSSTATSPIPFTVTFSESVTGFIQGDLTVTGGTVSGFSGSGSTYTFSVTPSAAGAVTVNVPANVAQDGASNGNTAATQFSITYRPVTPTPALTTPANNSSVATNQPTYSGTAPANATVTVYVDGSSRGTTTADAAGNWSFTQPSALNSGSHTVYVTAQLSNYAVSGNSNVNNFTVLNPATYASSTASQASTGRVLLGSTNQAILQVAVTIGGGPDLPLSAQSFSFTTNGSTSAADIAAARVYYTGTSSTFATTTAFGSAISSPNGTFSVTGAQQLSNGVNYFWLAYDVAANATPGNVLDATVSSLTISGTAYTPSVTSPTGNRQIVKTSRVAGTALRFAGDNTIGYVDFSADATHPAPQLNGSYTQQAWIKPGLNTSSTEYYVLGNGTGSTAAPYISITGNGRLEAGFGTGSALVFTRTSPNTLLAGWNHVAATYDATSDVLTLYLNGEAVGTQTSATAPASTRVNYVGSAGTTGTDYYFPGDIDEVSQWNRALSQTEIRQLRHLILSGTESGLVSYLQFNDSGTTTTDVISGTVGTLTGATRVTSTAPVGYGVSSLVSVTGTGNYVFAGTKAAINFSNAGTTPYDVVVSRLDGQPLGTQVSDASLRNVFTPAYWIVDRYSASTFAATITYTLSPTDISAADAAAPSNLKLYKRESNSDGAFDLPISASAANAAAGTVSFPVTSFSQMVIGSYGTSPLPVELVAFSAERVGKDGLLRWTTAQEKNNARFEVESSVDGHTFRSIGRVAGQGTSTNRHDYQLTDANLARYASGVVYYRLRQVDTDGAEHLSHVVTLAVPQAGNVISATAFPNPATDQLSVRVGGVKEGKVDCQLFDAQGRKVLHFSQRLTADYQSDLSTSVRHLPNGAYQLRITLPERVVNQSVIIAR